MAWIAGFLVLAGLRFVATFPVARNSDDANTLLAGIDMVAGNWRLHGWTLAPDNFMPTDMLAQGLASLVLGFRPVLTEAVEAAIWALVALVATSLTIRPLAGWSRLAAAVIVATLITAVADYAGLMNAFLTGVGSHGSTILLTLLCFQLATRHRRQADAMTLPMLGVLVLVGSSADPIFITTCALPLLAACMLHPRCRGGTRLVVLMAAAVLGAVALSRLLLRLNVASGGFGTTPLLLQFASFDDTLAHLGFALHAVIALLGADFFDRVLTPSLTGGPLLALLRFPLVVLFLLVLGRVVFELARAVGTWPRSPDASIAESETLDHLLCLGALICVGAAVVTRVIVDQSCFRFFLPATVFGIVLMVRRLAVAPTFMVYASFVSAASVAVLLLLVAHGPRLPVIASADDWRLAQTLRDHDLHHGYGGYWQGSIITMLSRGDVKILTLLDDKGKAARPYDWFVNRGWYRDAADTWHGRVFFVATSDAASPVDLSQQTVLHMFGPPIQIVTSGSLLIDIYQADGHMLDRLRP